MELIKKVIEEIKLREHGKYGALENLSNVELYAMAYRLGIRHI